MAIRIPPITTIPELIFVLEERLKMVNREQVGTYTARASAMLAGKASTLQEVIDLIKKSEIK